MNKKYGTTALVAGASEGIGAAYATHLAQAGYNLLLVARREEPLAKLADHLEKKYAVSVTYFCCDLAAAEGPSIMAEKIATLTIDLFVYNAALPFIGKFENDNATHLQQMIQTNVTTPLHLIHLIGTKMLAQKKGAIIQMASLAGFQGSGFLSVYAATKAFDRILAEGLWYEWKERGVDVIACCAGATATPNYINSKPVKVSFFAPKVQSPEEVVTECFERLGKVPSFVSGSGNKVATFLMQRLMPRKLAINIMGDTARKMYGF